MGEASNCSIRVKIEYLFLFAEEIGENSICED